MSQESAAQKAILSLKNFEGAEETLKTLADVSAVKEMVLGFDEQNLLKLFFHLHKNYRIYMANENARFAIRQVLVEKHNYTADQIRQLEKESESKL